jgi:heme oxygenase
MHRLRERTAAIHAATEALPLMRNLLAEDASISDYRRYLQALYGVYLAVEPALYAAVSPTLLSRLGIRPKLPALQRDLDRLGVRGAPPASALRQRLRETVTGEPCALGGLYVLEGATLGGQQIARRLRQRWADQPQLPFAFLEHRAANPGHDWKRFRQTLTDWAQSNAADAEAGRDAAVVDGALAVFAAMHRAFADTETQA